MSIHKAFIAIDGPNGVGKSTIIELLKQQLKSSGYDFVFTKEPTNSDLGNFIREKHDSYKGQALAALVVADRYDHIARLIKPNCEQEKVVITDRYVASSFVYQILDGLSYNFILNLNHEIIWPGLYIILTGSSETLKSRLSSRSELTRFESKGLQDSEILLFNNVETLLSQRNIEVRTIATDSRPSETIAAEVGAVILNYLNTTLY